MVAPKVHDLGDENALTFTTTVGGSPTDPDTLVFKIREPDGLVTTYAKGTDVQVEAVSTGVWRVLWTCRKAGRHAARFQATGNINQSEKITFFVARDPILGSSLPEP